MEKRTILDSASDTKTVKEVSKIIHKYLKHEWHEQKKTSKEFNEKTHPTKALDSPQQRNSVDCGAYVLQNMEKFMSETPVEQKNITANWYQLADVKRKRYEIEQLLQGSTQPDVTNVLFYELPLDEACDLIKMQMENKQPCIILANPGEDGVQYPVQLWIAKIQKIYFQTKDKANGFEWDTVIPILSAKETAEYKEDELSAYKNTVLQCQWFDPIKSDSKEMRLDKGTVHLNLNQVMALYDHSDFLFNNNNKLLLKQNHIDQINKFAHQIAKEEQIENKSKKKKPKPKLDVEPPFVSEAETEKRDKPEDKYLDSLSTKID